jgi:flagellar protein FliO/FliZ
MIGDERPSSARPDPALATLHRDAALSRVSNTRKLVAAGAAALTAGLAWLAATATPGRTLGTTGQSRSAGVTPAPNSGSSSASQSLPPLASPSDLGLQGPGSAPSAASAPSPAPADQSQVAPDQSQVAPAPSQAAPAQSAPQAAAPAPVVSGGS